MSSLLLGNVTKESPLTPELLKSLPGSLRTCAPNVSPASRWRLVGGPVLTAYYASALSCARSVSEKGVDERFRLERS
jgi:hypothetical protein